MNKKMRVAILLVICLFLTATAIAQDGRIVRETVYSPSLEGNLLGDSPNRQVTIYLPPSYDDGLDMAYPVVYLLHGYTGNNELWTGGSYISGSILNSMKSWLKEDKAKEMILVMPNSYNRFGGSFYTNSPVTGNWADFITKDLVKYMDNNYRTLPQRESRVVMGHSMGGYGAIKLGMLYPGIFNCIGELAGADDLGEFADTRLGSHAQASTITDWPQFYSAGWLVQSCFAVAAAFIPNLDRPPFYCDFPYVYTDTKPTEIVKNQEAFDKILQHDIHRMLESRIDALLSMRAIYIDCGTRDEPSTLRGSRRLHDELSSLGVDHVYKEFSGDHTCCVMTSTGDALEVFSSAMAFEMLVGVEAAGKLSATWGQIRKLE